MSTELQQPDSAPELSRYRVPWTVFDSWLGVVMLVQPVSITLYSYSFVTVLAGTLMFTIVSKFPE